MNEYQSIARKRPRRYRTRSARRTRWWQLIALTCGPAAILVVLLVATQADKAATDLGKDLCPLGTSNQIGHTILLIDQTDPVTGAQKTHLRNQLDTLKSVLRPTERLSLYTISGNTHQAPSRIFSLCNPGDGADANPLIRTPAKAQAEFDQRFNRPLDSVVGRLNISEVADQSPIMEALKFLVSIDDFGPQVGKRRLVIFSDMLQHTDFSHYRHGTSYGDFASDSERRGLIADLRGVDVQILYLKRRTRKSIQGSEHISFWRSYFEDAGAIAQFDNVLDAPNAVSGADSLIIQEREGSNPAGLDEFEGACVTITTPENGERVGVRQMVGGYARADLNMVWLTVQPLKTNAFYVNGRARVGPNGRWSTTIQFGEDISEHKNLPFAIRVLAVPNSPLRLGMVAQEWPQAACMSDIVGVRRN